MAAAITCPVMDMIFGGLTWDRKGTFDRSLLAGESEACPSTLPAARRASNRPKAFGTLPHRRLAAQARCGARRRSRSFRSTTNGSRWGAGDAGTELVQLCALH